MKKRPLAYITAPWGENEFENTEKAAKYCRDAYEAGFSPFCPVLVYPMFLRDDIPQEHNDMKAMANKARMESYNTGKIAYSATAKKAYAKEVKDLNNKLNEALRNTTKERAAQRLANAELKAKKAADPDMKKEDQKKVAQRALNKYRNELGTVSRKDRNIKITDREWEAIQSGAISENTLQKILSNADVDELRQRATPRTYKTVSSGQAARIKAMSASYTIKEIADKLNLSTSTVSKILKGKE